MGCNHRFISKKCKRYVSRFNEERATARNAFEYKFLPSDMPYVFPPKSIQNALFTKLILEKQRFLGIYHSYQEVPAWVGLAGGQAHSMKLDYDWLIKNNINGQTASLVPSKKRSTNWGYYKMPKENYTLTAIIYHGNTHN